MSKFLVVFLAFLAGSLADEAADKALQQAFCEMKDELATARDSCFQTTSMKIEDLRDYEKSEDATETELCFYKCFYEAIGLIQKGKFVPENIALISTIRGMKENETEEVKKCVEGLEEIQTCDDMKTLDECLF